MAGRPDLQPLPDEVIGVPALSREDALAAVEWIIDDGEHSIIELGGETLYGQVAESLMHAVRDYLARV